MDILLRLFEHKTYFKDVTTQLSIKLFALVFSLDLNLLLSENSVLLVVFYSAIAVRQQKVTRVFPLMPQEHLRAGKHRVVAIPLPSAC